MPKYPQMNLFRRIGNAEINTYFRYAQLAKQHTQVVPFHKEVYKSSFFPQTIRDWNDLLDSLISFAEMPGDCVCMFAFLVRIMD